jgi:hypothetical protein
MEQMFLIMSSVRGSISGGNAGQIAENSSAGRFSKFYYKKSPKRGERVKKIQSCFV